MPHFKVLAQTTHKPSIKEVLFEELDHWTFKNLDRLSRKHLKNGAPQLNIRAFDFVSHCINFQGIYEIKPLQLIFTYFSSYDHLFKSSVAIDVGANIGNHSVYFSKFFSKVISIEPNPFSYELLKLNAQLAIQKNIECVNIGASDTKGELVYSYADPANSGSVFLSPTNNSKNNKNIIKVDSLDNNYINEKISLIKIDVEGMELQVINGALKIIKKQMPFILFEQAKTSFINQSSPVIDKLSVLGYKSFAIDESLPNFPTFGSSIVSRLINFIGKMTRRRIERLVIVKANEILPRDYTFIIALPDWAEA
jgi:FkbM family methyltransferase